MNELCRAECPRFVAQINSMMLAEVSQDPEILAQAYVLNIDSEIDIKPCDGPMVVELLVKRGILRKKFIFDQERYCGRDQ